MKVLRAGIVGTGFIGALYIEAIRRIPNACVTAVSTKEEQLAEAQERFGVTRGYADWRALVADPEVDVIHNCTPNALHDAVNRAALLAGKPVYAEKPLSTSAAEAAALCRLARERHVPNALNHQYRLNAAVQEMRARVAAHACGRPLFVRGQYLQEVAARPTDYTERRFPEDSPARALADLGVHWADAAQCVLGQPIAAVYAQCYIHHPVRTDPLTGARIPIHSDDTTGVLLRFADGTPGMALFSKAMVGHKNDLTLTVSGEECEYTWSQQSCDRLSVGNRVRGNETVFLDRATASAAAAPYITLPPGHAMGWTEALTNSIRAFYASLREGAWARGPQPYATFLDGWRGNAFIEACLLSARESRWVELPEAPV